MTRKALALLLALACCAMASACDPCPTCIHEAATPTVTMTPVIPTVSPTPTASTTPTPTPSHTGTATPTATPTGFGPASFQGTYSIRFSGTGGSGNPDAAVGILDSDGISKVTGMLTENKDGTICQFILGGSYAVNPNRTATINLTATPTVPGCKSGAGVQAMVLFNMGSGAAFINTGVAVLLGTLIRQ